MKIIEMNINNRLERIDNKQIKKDNKGYYIQKWDGENIFFPNYDKIYLTSTEVKAYEKILKHNNAEDVRENKIAEAKRDGRVEEIKQKISNDILDVIYYVYYDENGNRI